MHPYVTQQLVHMSFLLSGIVCVFWTCVFILVCLAHRWHICSASLVEHCALGALRRCYTFFSLSIHHFVYHAWKTMWLCTWNIMDPLRTWCMHCGHKSAHLWCPIFCLYSTWPWTWSSPVSCVPFQNGVWHCPKYLLLSSYTSFLMSGRCLDCETCITHLIILIILYYVLYIRQTLHTVLFLFHSESLPCVCVCVCVCEREREREREREVWMNLGACQKNLFELLNVNC